MISRTFRIAVREDQTEIFQTEKGWKIEARTVSLPALDLDGESRELVLLLSGSVIYGQNAHVLSHGSDIPDAFLKEKDVSCLKKR